MPIIFILLLGLVALPFLKNKVKISEKYFFFLSVGFIFLYQVYKSWSQFVFWRDTETIMRFFLPPYQSVKPYLLYSLREYFLVYLISFAAAILFLIGAWILNRFRNFQIFEKQESYLGASAIFILGVPLGLFYVPVILGAALLLSLYQTVFKKQKNKRISLYYFWGPVALLVYLIK